RITPDLLPCRLSRNTELPFSTARPIVFGHDVARIAKPRHLTSRSIQAPSQAIEAACRLIDDGCDVYGVGTGPLTDSINREQIARIYAMWAGAKFPFGGKQWSDGKDG